MLHEIQRAVHQVMQNAQLADFTNGQVVSPPPGISVKLENTEIILDSSQLIVSEDLLPRTVNFETDILEQSSKKDGPYTETFIRGSIKLTDTLKVGDEVLLFQMAGGQKYFIMARGVSYGADS